MQTIKKRQRHRREMLRKEQRRGSAWKPPELPEIDIHLVGHYNGATLGLTEDLGTLLFRLNASCLLIIASTLEIFLPGSA